MKLAPSRTDADTGKPLSRFAWYEEPVRRALLPMAVILAVEVLLRDVLIAPRDAVTDAYIRNSILVEGAMGVGLVLWVWRIERASLESVGLSRFRLRYLGVGALGFVAAMLLSVLAGPVLKSFGLAGLPSLQPLLKRLDPSTRALLFMTGTIFEELFYRGFLIERISAMSRRRWIGAVASWLAFTSVHLGFFGLGPTLDVGLLAMVLVVVYVRERSLWPCVVLHGLNGVFGYLLMPLMPIRP